MLVKCENCAALMRPKWTVAYGPCCTICARPIPSQQAPVSRRLARVMERDGRRCRRCGSLERPSIDHVIPRARGGSNRLENLQVLCQPCNERKADSLPA